MQNERITWEDLRVLLAVSRGASFLAAGQALGLATSTVARRISALEAHLRARLVRRSSSGTSMEKSAASLLKLAERIEAELAVTARDLSPEPEKIAGTVRLSVGDGFTRFGARVAAAFRREHPEAHVELVAEQRMADLPKREADLALRAARSSSDAVITKKIGELLYGVYASEEYLRRIRAARISRSNFAAHDFVIYEGFLENQPEVRWLRARGAARFPFRANNTDGIVEGAILGQGLAALPTLLADSVPTLRRLRLEEDPPCKSVFIAMHRDLRTVPRVRVLSEIIAREFAQGAAPK